MINPTSLPGVHTERWHHAVHGGLLFLRSNRLRYGQWHRRRVWPQACSYSRPHPIAREKASSVVSQSIRPNS